MNTSATPVDKTVQPSTQVTAQLRENTAALMHDTRTQMRARRGQALHLTSTDDEKISYFVFRITTVKSSGKYPEKSGCLH